MEDDEVHGLAALVVQGDDGLEDLLVGVGVEVLFVNDEDHVADDEVVLEHTAQDALFRLPVVWREPVREIALGCHRPDLLVLTSRKR